MGLTRRMNPGERFPAVSEGDTVVLTAKNDAAHRPFEVPGLPDLTILTEGSVRVVGSLTPRGGEPDCTIRVYDGADRLKILGPLDISGSGGRGLRVTLAKDVLVQEVTSHDHDTLEAFIFGNCPGLQHLGCTGYNCNGDDHSHAVYYSGDMTGAYSKGFHGYDCGGSFQVNGAALGYKITGFVAEDALLERIGSAGTKTVSLMAVFGGRFRRFRIVNAMVGILEEFSDGRGAEWACHKNIYEAWDIVGDPGSGVASEEGSSGARFIAWTGWTPPGMEPGPAPIPPPTPSPVPPPDTLAQVRAALAGLDEPLSSLAHHADRVRGVTLKAAIKADWKALSDGVARAKGAAHG